METAAWLPSELDKSAEALISEMEKEFVHLEPEETSSNAEAGEVVSVEAAAENPSVVSGHDLAKKPPELDLSEAVRRELGLSAREQTIAGLERDFQAMKLELDSYRRRDLPEDYRVGLQTQASRTLEAMGIDPAALVKQVLAERMGDKAPAELREEVARGSKDWETSRKIRALEEKLEYQDKANQARTYFEGVQAGARKYVTDVGINEHAPTVAKVAKRNSERVFAELMEEIQADAREKAVRDPKASLITYEEAARRVEKRWSELNTYLLPENASATSTKMSETPKIPPNTQATGSIKPPDRPLAPWLNKSTDLESEGIKAALAEYRRLETPGRS